MNQKEHKALTIKDIARLAGVSIATVSRAMSGNGYVSPEAKEQVDKIVKKYNFIPSSKARSLVTHKSGVIGLVVPFIDSPFFVAFVNGVQLTAKKHGQTVILCYSENNVEDEERILRMLCEQRVDGIIAVPAGRKSTGYKKVCDTAHIPVVFAMRTIDDNSFSAVTANDYQGAYNAVNHLIQHGHTDIGFIVGDYENMSTFADRWKGARQAMKDHGLSIRPEWVGYCKQFGKAQERAIQDILEGERLPTAIYSDYQMNSIPVVKALQNAELKIPEDISVCAFDGFEDSYCEGWMPVLDGNIHPSREIGVQSVKMLEEILEKGGVYHKVIDLKFYEHGTVAARTESRCSGRS